MEAELEAELEAESVANISLLSEGDTFPSAVASSSSEPLVTHLSRVRRRLAAPQTPQTVSRRRSVCHVAQTLPVAASSLNIITRRRFGRSHDGGTRGARRLKGEPDNPQCFTQPW